MLKENLEAVEERIRAACIRAGRSRDEVTLIAVSKTVEPARVNLLKGTGVTQLGENRVQEILEKFPFLDASFAIHQIGQLQTNKVKYIIDKVCMVQSLDRESLAQEIDRRAQQCGRRMPVLLQVNIGHEPQKGGMEPEAVLPFARAHAAWSGLEIQGLMAVMPNTRDETVLRPLFRRMRALFEQLRADMANNALTGRVFTGESIGDIADYVFVTYTVPVRNFNLLRAEWIELAVQPQEGDVTQLFTGDAQQVAGLRSAELRATVLCRLDEQTAAARTPSLSVNYFIFGRAYSFSL